MDTQFRHALATLLTVVPLVGVYAADRFWDYDSTSGLTSGDGAWSASEARWATASNPGTTTPGVWVGGNAAYFSTPVGGGKSVVTLSSAVTASSFSINGAPYRVVISSGGSLSGMTGTSYIGNGATGNEFVVTGTGVSLNMNGRNLTVGSGTNTGKNNKLTISSGAVVTNLALYVGNSSGADGNQVVVDGARILTSPTLSISVGEAGSQNSMVLTNNAILRRGYTANGGATVVGKGAGKSGNTITVSTNCVWDNGNGYLYVGGSATASGAFSNRVVIDGGSFTNIGGNQRVSLGEGNGSWGNSILVKRGGLFQWGEQRAFGLGYGSGASNNTFEVTDGGRVISSRGNFNIGGSASGWSNRFIVGRNALVTNSYRTYVGRGTGAKYNTLRMDGGTMFVEQLTADRADNGVDFRGGILCTLSTSTFSNGVALVVGDGQQTAVLDARSTCNASPGLVITNNGVLAGLGPLIVTVAPTTVHGTVNPGIYRGRTGVLAHTGDFTLKPTAVTQIDIGSTSATPGVGWDRLAVTGTLTLGGTLKPVLQGGFVPSASDSFASVLSSTVALVGSLTGKSSGDRIWAYAAGLPTPVGSFRLVVGATSITLDNYQAGGPSSAGTVLLVR